MLTLWIFSAWLFGTSLVHGQRIQIQDVRLVNGPNANSGRLEVFVNGQWGTVCDDQWDNLDATVACRMLNYRNGGEAVIRAGFGQGTGTIFLDDVACDGSEARLDDCQMASSAVPVNCLHAEDAGVICDPSTPTAGPTTQSPTTKTVATAAPVPDNCSPTNPASNVRLLGYNQGMGLLEARNGNTGAWGTVCDDFFDENAAKVVCRSLCFDPVFARAGAPAGTYDPPTRGIILDDVRCNGNEASIQDCNTSNWGTHNCAATEAATVTCVDLNSQPPQPPVPILECREGYLIAAFSKVRDPFLEQKHLTIANPVNGPCNRQFSEDNSTVIIRIPFENCGTEVTYNSTHIIYKNVIKYDFTRLEGAITRVNTYMVEVFCEMPRNEGVTRPLDPLTQMVTQKSIGRFVVTMSFYRNNSFTDPANELPLRIPLGEWLNVALQLESIDRRLKLIVPNCIATPNADMNNPINFPLFENSCRNEPTLAFFNLNQTRFGYRYQPFMFVNYDEVFLHCGAFVCLLSDDSAECDRSCNNSKTASTTGRRKREAMPEKVFVHSGPMVVYKLDNSMTVIERIGRPTVWVTSETDSTTSTATTSTSATTTTSSPVYIGTSVKMRYQSSTTSIGGVSSTTSKSTPSTGTTTSRSTTTTTSTTSSTSTSQSTSTAAEKSKPAALKMSTTSKSKPSETTTKLPPLETPEPDGTFLIERGANLESQKNTQVLRGYLPLTASAVHFHVSNVILHASLTIGFLARFLHW